MENRKQSEKEKMERLTAILSLSATSKEPRTPCLTAQEMATLIEEPDGHENFTRCQHHLSSCDKCYQEWLSLKKMSPPSVKRSRVFQFPGTTSRKLTGTALAIAASVAIFLNIPYHQDAIFEQEVPIQDIAPQKSPQPPANLQKRKIEKVDNRFSLDSKSAQQEHLEAEFEAIDQELPPESKEQRSQPESSMRPKAMQTGSAPSAPPAIAEISELDNWISGLEMHCQSARQTPSFWLTIQLEGEQLLQKPRTTVSDPKRTKVLLLLQLLNGIKDEESALSQCRLIRSELAEEE